MASAPEEAIVIGASLSGLCAAWQLRKQGVERITVLERRRIGHRAGACHGRSRLLSCVGYVEPVLGLLKLARDVEWPQLEKELGRRVLRPIEGLAVGPLGPAFVQGVKTSFGSPGRVSPLTLPDARKRFPQLVLPEGSGTVVDRTALLIAAESATEALLELLQREGIQIVPKTTVRSLHSTADGVWVETERGRWMAERAIVTAGSSTADLFDRSASRVSQRNIVSAFYSLDIPDADWRAGRFPVVRVVDDAGLAAWTVTPEFADRGVKVTRHSTEEVMDTSAQLDALRVWFEATFKVGVTGQLGREVRQVVRITDRPMLIDTHHDDPRIVFATGNNGEEVALAPVIGRSLAELVLNGRSDTSEFQRNRKHFALPRRSLPARRKRPRSGAV